MAAGDIYKASEAQTTASQREALAALARGGTAERDAYLAGVKAQQEDRGRVLQDIMARATDLNAGAAGAELAAAAQPGMDRRSQALLAAQQSSANALAPITEANRVYFDQVNAAVPLVKARSDEINEANRLKAIAEEQDRQMRLAIQQMQLEGQYASLANTQQAGANARARAAGGGGGAGSLSDSELRTRLTGAAQVAKSDLEQRRQSTALQPGMQARAGDVRMTDQLNDDPANAPLHELARRIGVAAGIDPMRVYGVVSAPEQKPIKTTQAAHRLNVVDRVERYASDNTALAFTEIVAASSSYAKALQTLAGIDKDQLRADKVSTDVLKRWLSDYYSGG